MTQKRSSPRSAKWLGFAIGIWGTAGCGVPDVSIVQDASTPSDSAAADARADAQGDDGAGVDAAAEASADGAVDAAGDAQSREGGPSDAGANCPQPAPDDAAVCCGTLWCVNCVPVDCMKCETTCPSGPACCIHGNLKCMSSCP